MFSRAVRKKKKKGKERLVLKCIESCCKTIHDRIKFNFISVVLHRVFRIARIRTIFPPSFVKIIPMILSYSRQFINQNIIYAYLLGFVRIALLFHKNAISLS